MVQIALAEDATEAEEIQALLEDAGIESAVQFRRRLRLAEGVRRRGGRRGGAGCHRAADQDRRVDRGVLGARYSRTEFEPRRADEAGARGSKMQSDRPSASGGEGTLPFQTVSEATCGRAQVIPFTLSSDRSSLLTEQRQLPVGHGRRRTP